MCLLSQTWALQTNGYNCGLWVLATVAARITAEQYMLMFVLFLSTFSVWHNLPLWCALPHRFGMACQAHHVFRLSCNRPSTSAFHLQSWGENPLFTVYYEYRCYDWFSSPVGTENRGSSEVGGILTTAHREFSGCAHHCAGKPKRRDQDQASLRRRGRARSGTAEE